jgi:quercetin dioxygenase-like cupin family protein
MLRSLLLAILAFPFSALPISQDPVTVAPAMVKVEFENDQIRVLRVQYGPHQKMPLHGHPGRVVLLLTDANRSSTSADGTTRTAVGKSGEIVWHDPMVHQVENLADSPYETIELEVKPATVPAIAVAAEKPTTKEPVPVQFEPHHHFVFQNQFVRVLDVTMSAGEPSLFHTHSNDNVSIDLSGDKSQAQPMGGEWQPAGDVVHGRAAFHKAVGQPYTHRVRSAGKLPYHVIDIEILP